jgi:CRISPR-associated protein Cas2
MLVLVSYDVSTVTPAGRRRLKKVSTACTGYGVRVQYSVFECDLDPAQWERLRARLTGIIVPTEDSLRFYFLGSNWERKVEHVGLAKAPDMKGVLAL